MDTLQLLKQWIENERTDYETHKHQYSDRLRLTMIDRQITLSEVLMQIESLETYTTNRFIDELVKDTKHNAINDGILK